MRVHFIAIGGSAMHNLAIALAKKGYVVTGSDDDIFDPAKSRLQQHGILPPAMGWHPERITADIDAVVLGMHAHADNPELLRAQQLGLTIYSYPEYLYEQSKDKTRIVVGGSHGKTTITAMILHALRHAGMETDYMVGAQLEGFDVMVRLGHTAKHMVIEGDEYLTSPLDHRSKFLLYHPNIAIISGIEWDHVNVFPTFESYLATFSKFIEAIEPGGYLIYCADDDNVVRVVNGESHHDLTLLPYHVPRHDWMEDGTMRVLAPDGTAHALQVFGQHNMQNLMAARHVCQVLGMSDGLFFQAMETFKGASKRLELVRKVDGSAFYKDFAHAPSKLRATVAAMKEAYPRRTLVACMELHTYSSLTRNFCRTTRAAWTLPTSRWFTITPTPWL